MFKNIYFSARDMSGTIVLPTVDILSISNLESDSFTASAAIADNGGGTIALRGMHYKVKGANDSTIQKTFEGPGEIDFLSHITGLTAVTRYMVRAYAINEVGEGISDWIEALTLINKTAPTVLMQTETNLTSLTATWNAVVSDIGYSAVLETGFKYGRSSSPDESWITVDASIATLPDISKDVIDLYPGTTYYIVATATNLIGIGYSEIYSVRTPNAILSVATSAASAVMVTTATIGVRNIDSGGVALHAKGVRLYKGATLVDDFISGDATEADFMVDLTSLDPNTSYSYVGYASSSHLTTEGAVLTFTTANAIPTINTKQVSNITATSVWCGGFDLDARTFDIIEKGVCWSTSGTPTITDNVVISGNTSDADFTTVINGLTANQNYFIRSYITTEFTTSSNPEYGAVVTARTLSGIASIVTTNAVINSLVSVEAGGYISDYGGASAVERGIFWGYTSDPVSDGTKIIATGGDSFSVIIDDPNLNTTVYVVAYITTVSATTYATSKTFVVDVPIVNSTAIGATPLWSAATFGGTIGDMGSLDINQVTEVGVYYCKSEDGDPTAFPGNVQTLVGNTFNSDFVALTPYTEYKVQAYIKTTDAQITTAAQTLYTTTIPEASILETTAVLPELESASSILIGGKDINVNGQAVVSKGVYWGTSPSPTALDNLEYSAQSDSDFELLIDNLTPGTTYYIIAFIETQYSVAVAPQTSITTDYGTAFITTKDITVSSLITAASGGVVTDDGGSTIIETGVYWGTFYQSTTNKVADGTSTDYVSVLNSLPLNTQLYVTAYVTTGVATTLATSKQIIVQKPILSATAGPTVPGWRAAAFNGFLNAIGSGGEVTEVGIYYCLKSAGDPSINGTRVIVPLNLPAFTTVIDTLLPETYYNMLAFVVTSEAQETLSPTIVEFTTDTPPLSIAGTTSVETSITTILASGDTLITSEQAVTEKGIYYRTASSATEVMLSLDTTPDDFDVTLTGLTPGETYFIQSFVSTSYATALGPEIARILNSGIPEVSTVTPVIESLIRVETGGTIEDYHGGTITQRGVCWGSAMLPTIADNKVVSATTTEFASTINNPDLNITLYVRAFATTSYGTYYGQAEQFKVEEPVVIATALYAEPELPNAKATFECAFTNPTGLTIAGAGVLYDLVVDGETAGEAKDALIASGTDTTVLSSDITLVYDTQYKLMAYVITPEGQITYSPVINYIETFPVEVTVAVTQGTTIVDISLNGNVNKTTATEVGFHYGTTPTKDGTWVTVDPNDVTVVGQNFSIDILNVTPETLYYVQAYAIIDTVEIISDVGVFTYPSVTLAAFESNEDNALTANVTQIISDYQLVVRRGVDVNYPEGPA